MPTPDPDDAIEPPRTPGYSVHVPEHLKPAPPHPHGPAPAHRAPEKKTEPPARLPEAPAPQPTGASTP